MKKETLKWIVQIIASIADYICYVPKVYRFTNALTYFVESYENTRAANLEQAVHAYDAYAQSKGIRDSIDAMRRSMCRDLQAIQARQLATKTQLAQVNATVWQSDFAF